MTPYKRSNGTWTGTFQYRGRRIGIGTHPTRKAALKAEQKKREEVEGLSPETFEGWAERWLRDYARPSERTNTNYAYVVKALVRELGHRNLATIDRLEALRRARRWPRHYSLVASAMFNDAIDAGFATKNPFANLRFPQSRGRKDLNALTEKQIIKLADAAIPAFETSPRPEYGQVMRALILFGFYTAVRPGELRALKTADLKGDEIIVRGTKTAAANRRITIASAALHAINEMPRWFDSPWLFFSIRGKQLNRWQIGTNFRKVREEAGMEHVDLYDLRHAGATYWTEQGVPAWAVAQLLGHSDHGALVQKLYSHPREGEARSHIRAADQKKVMPIQTHSKFASGSGRAS